MKQRDDTPSVIRSIPPASEEKELVIPRESVHPVMTVPRSFLIWRRVKIISVIVGVVIALLVMGFTVRHYIITTKTDAVIEKALKIESVGTAEKLKQANDILSELVKEYPGIDKVRSAHVWVMLVQAHLFGPEPELIEQAKKTLKDVQNDESGIGLAARAALESASGNFDASSKITSRAMLENGKEPRLEMVRVWSLVAKGESKLASEKITAAVSTWPEYLPFVSEGLRLALQIGDKVMLEKMMKNLDASGETHLWSALGALAHLLPDWGEKIERKKLGTRILAVVKELRSKIEAAPPKQRSLARLLEGRASLVANQTDKAIVLLGESMDHDPNAETLGWLAFSTMREKGCSQTLDLLGKHPEMITPGILDVAARCSLKLHKLEKASALIDQLEASGSLKRRIKNLRFGLFVRSGDTDEAFKKMPKLVHKEQLWLAIELYYLLKQSGRRKDASALSAAFDDTLLECGKSMRTWLNKWGRKTLRNMNISSESPCQAALVSKLFWGRIDPRKIKNSAELASKESGSLPMNEVQRAKAIWLVNGRKEAVALLDKIWSSKPEGRPLKCELARAYLDMGIINRALEVLDGEEHPEAIALRFEAGRAIKEKGLGELVELAKKVNKEKSHPATIYVLAKHLYTEAKYEAAAALVEPEIRGSGAWTSELAELAAKAINFSGDRSHADRLLRDSERYLGTTAGLDELIEMKLVRANLNLRRGGSKFLGKASDILSRMKKERIPDAEMMIGLSIVRLQNGNGPGAGKLLREALKINPSLTRIYSQIKKNEEELDSETLEILGKTWPDWSP